MNKDYLHPGAMASIAAVIAMMMVTLIIIYIFFIEKPSLRYENLPFPVLKSPLYPGDVLPLTIRRCSDSPKRRVITSARYLENLGDDQEVLVMEMMAAFIPPGCATQLVRIHRLPESTTPGQYRLIGAATVPGLIRDFKVEWYSAPFNVIARLPAVGTAGAQGEKGEKGVQGDKGATGAQGAQGPPGLSK